MKKIVRLCVALLCLLPKVLLSSELLHEEGIKKMMDKLIEYHVDAQEVSIEILSRSLSSYIQAFDAHKSYLSQQEVAAFLYSPEVKKRLLKNYKASNFIIYRNINQVIRESILRARQWRKEWAKNPKELVLAASSHQISKQPSQWCKSLDEVKERQRALLFSYLSLYLSGTSLSRYEGKEEQLVGLCIRQIENHENAYLGINDYGVAMDQDEEAYCFHIRIVKALAHSLDAHTAYFSKDEALAMRIQLEKGMCGIGVVLKEDIDGVIVKEIVPGGPAAKSGDLQLGDIIYRVDNNNIESLSFRGVLDCLRGGPGSTVILDIHRGNSDHTITLKREKICLEDRRVDVAYEAYGDGVIGKITLHSFYEGENQVSSEQDLRRAIQELKEKNLLGLVLDIRENTGGFLSQAIKVSGLFMTNGVVVVSRYADGSIKCYRTVSPKKFYDGPLAILVSKSSASAAEIVAQTLQDYGVALIIGDEQTYGKGTIQHQTITGDGSHEDCFKVTVGKYYSPSGKSTQLQGVKSDILIPSRYAEDRLGERFLDHPLPTDYCDNVLHDPLMDLDSHTRPWFQKYYLPNLQKQETLWREMLPQLMVNSQQRLSENQNFQSFLSQIKSSEKSDLSYGLNDLQLEESINILKDMILLQSKK
ncbi:Tail-specific protease precursor,carboxy-terminal protease,C-terminal processing peptidase,Peptidase family S41 [Chlamydia serpentis]|uniref:Tail-specific protease,carboxy-terminal protease,C-terminal processing peptidase,Peptidase family S41 n=1 Tax=Chlamydia serpentis TaxID=1967782 RepID=A0A2R8FB76_9CHLA|nr:S41 family peptidase [Chlamydia serpentis]SPN73674.1 Tail-specific protease precursor,carboxy-terminal protease,C-terminal processing peptidase,Peptidase family S41 [Chlamydia serpentis]